MQTFHPQLIGPVKTDFTPTTAFTFICALPTHCRNCQQMALDISIHLLPDLHKTSSFSLSDPKPCSLGVFSVWSCHEQMCFTFKMPSDRGHPCTSFESRLCRQFFWAFFALLQCNLYFCEVLDLQLCYPAIILCGKRMCSQLPWKWCSRLRRRRSQACEGSRLKESACS